MHDAKQGGRDVTLFVLIAIASSLVLSYALWQLPAPMQGYSLTNAIFLVPAASVMAAALGVGLRRKVLFIAATLGGFVLLDMLGYRSGLLQAAAAPETFLIDEWHTLATFAYVTFVAVYPLVALVFFIGPRPAILWTHQSRHPRREIRRSR